MSKKVAKSSIVIQKEKELKELQKQKKKIQTNLKRQKTILDTLKTNIVDMQRQMASGVFSRMFDINTLKTEITDLLYQVKRSRKIRKKDKEGLDEFLADWERSFDFSDLGFDMEEMERQRAQAGHNTDEFDRQKAFEFFKEFEIQPEVEDQKAVRKLYVKLAARFHPDKAKSKREQEQFHQLMQRINTAYQHGDMQELLDIQQQYGDLQTLADVEVGKESVLVDFLDVEIEREKQELSLLESQLERVKKEVKNIRASELGDMLRVNQEAERYGYGTLDDAAEDLKTSYEEMEVIRDGLKEFLETGIMPKKLEEIVMGPSMEMDDFFMFGDEEDEDDALNLDDIDPEELLKALSDFFENIPDQKPPSPPRKPSGKGKPKKRK